METKNISVAIVTRNRPESLAKTLRTLVLQKKKPLEVILVENNQVKTLESVINKFKNKLKIKYFLEKEIGVASARNLALNVCQTKYLCFTDDDCLLHPSWLQEISKELANNPNVTYFIGDSLVANPNNIVAQMQGLRQRYWLKKKIKHNHFLANGYFDTKNIVLDTKKIISEKLSFETKLNRYPWGDISDQEFGKRVFKLGLTGKFVPKMIAYHTEADSLVSMTKKAYLRGRNTYILDNLSKKNINETYKLVARFFGRHSLKQDWSIFMKQNLLQTISLIILSKVYDLFFLIGYFHETQTKYD